MNILQVKQCSILKSTQFSVYSLQAIGWAVL